MLLESGDWRLKSSTKYLLFQTEELKWWGDEGSYDKYREHRSDQQHLWGWFSVFKTFLGIGHNFNIIISVHWQWWRGWGDDRGGEDNQKQICKEVVLVLTQSLRKRTLLYNIKTVFVEVISLIKTQSPFFQFCSCWPRDGGGHRPGFIWNKTKDAKTIQLEDLRSFLVCCWKIVLVYPPHWFQSKALLNWNVSQTQYLEGSVTGASMEQQSPGEEVG